jgi:hypothetical protein
MQTMIYDSDAFCVLQLDWEGPEAVDGVLARPGGYEIVDKFARKEIFIDGRIADGFRERVQHLMEGSPTTDDIDEFLDGFSSLSRQNLHAH